MRTCLQGACAGSPRPLERALPEGGEGVADPVGGEKPVQAAGLRLRLGSRDHCGETGVQDDRIAPGFPGPGPEGVPPGECRVSATARETVRGPGSLAESALVRCPGEPPSLARTGAERVSCFQGPQTGTGGWSSTANVYTRQKKGALPRAP